MLQNTLVLFILLLVKSFAAGLLTVLTPFIYAIFPITAGILAPKTSQSQRASVTQRPMLLRCCLYFRGWAY